MKTILFTICAILVLSCSSDSGAEISETKVESGSEKEIDLKDKIELKINEAINQFESVNHGFILTVVHSDTAIVQIIHTSYVEQTAKADNSFGLAVYVCFDPTYSDEILNHTKFLELSISKKFHAFESDGIPCYAFDIENNANLGAEIITELLNKVYDLDDNNELEIDLIDQGRLN